RLWSWGADVCCVGVRLRVAWLARRLGRARFDRERPSANRRGGVERTPPAPPRRSLGGYDRAGASWGVGRWGCLSQLRPNGWRRATSPPPGLVPRAPSGRAPEGSGSAL